MKGLLDAIARFFRSIFGGGKTSDSTPPVITEPTTQTGGTGSDTSGPGESSSSGSSSSGNSLAISLDRYNKGDKDILGKLSVGGEFMCYTLENSASKAHIPAGNYSLTLRDKGGLHATYAYRFGDKHAGMLQVKDVPDIDFAFLRIGNMASETDGGLVMGETVHNEGDTDSNREVWNSETSYLKVYPKIVGHIRNGGNANIHISES